MEHKHNPGYLVFQLDTEIILHSSDLINLIPCELGLTSNTFCDKKILTYDIELPPTEENWFLIYLIINILQSLMLLVQPQTHQPGINL